MLESQIPPSRSAAILTIHEAPRMTTAGRRRIAKWIRFQANYFELHGKQYSKRFIARYLYR